MGELMGTRDEKKIEDRNAKTNRTRWRRAKMDTPSIAAFRSWTSLPGEIFTDNRMPQTGAAC